MTKSELQELRKFIIGSYVLPEKINWPRDLRAASSLFKRYTSDKGFWNLACPDKPWSYSLTCMLKGKPKDILDEKFAKFKKQIDLAPKDVPLEKEKVGETYKPVNKLKSLKDFLKD